MIPQKTYPEDYSCIISPNGPAGGIYIGNLEAAQNLNTLQKHSIKAVLTAAKGIDLNLPKHVIPYTLYIPADDHQSFNLSSYFDKAADFIASALDKTNIMVHCLAGVSRSVSLVLGYLIKHKSYTYDQAFSLVKSRRRIIHPNDGFISQLKSYQTRFRIAQRRKSPSPQHHYSASPKKLSYNNFVSEQVSQFRRSNIGGSLKKQHHSHNEALNQEQEMQYRFKDLQLSRKYKGLSYEENKYQIKDASKGYEGFGKIRRLSSMNVTGNQYINTERRQYYGLLNNIENKKSQSPAKASKNITDIDRKIEQIRNKYRQMSGYPASKYSNHREIDENKPSTDSNGWDIWTKEDNRKKEYKYLPKYENIIENRQYQGLSSHFYSKDS